MSQLTELKSAVETVRRIVADLAPDCVRADDAVAWLAAFVEVERVAGAGRTLMAARIEESNAWRASGESSAAQFLAHTTGTSVGQAQSVLETAERLVGLPATADAFRSGRLSESQAQEVAAAAAVSPAAEGRLLERAAHSTQKQLRDECRRVRHAASDDEQARYDAIKRNRYLRTWTDAEGAMCGRFRTTPDSGARILAALDAEVDRVFRCARREGRREPRAAYAMDALEARVCSVGGAGKRPRTRTVINVLVDYQALVRGHTVAGETCEIAGIGSLPAAVVAAWRRDAYLSLIVTHGIDIKAVTRATRYVDVDQRRALAVRDRSCVIQRCDAESRLQRDHHVPFARGGPTAIDNLQHLCAFHHALKSKGWRLTGGVGCYRLVPPDGGGGRDPPACG